MDRSKRFSIQVGSIQNLSFKKVQPLIRLLIMPTAFFCLSFLIFALRMREADVFVSCTIGSILIFIGTLYLTVLLWVEHIQIMRYGRCSGDADLYFEGNTFLFFNQIKQKSFSVRFRLSDIDEFRLDENNTLIFVKVNSEIFENLDGTKSNSIKLNYRGDLSTAVMISEKIYLSFLGRDISNWDIQNELKNIRFQNLPISDLKKYISLNQRFNFVQKLFNGEKEEFFLNIEKLNSANEFEVLSLLQTIREKYIWEKDCEHAFEFTQLVKRRFL
jgi:hypothetical protein